MILFWFVLIVSVVSMATWAWYVTYNLDKIPFFVAVGVVLLIVVVSCTIIIMLPQDYAYTGEVVKFYVNGTALLDNGTYIPISSIPGMGCK